MALLRELISSKFSFNYHCSSCYSQNAVPNGPLQSYVEAAKFFGTAADQGYDEAQRDLGNLYLSGRGVMCCDIEGARWMKKAADQGFAPAQMELANLFRRGCGVKQNYAEAAVWFKKAALQGFIGAQYTLGIICAAGCGVKMSNVGAVR